MKIYRCQHCKFSVAVNKNKKGIRSAKYIMGDHYETKHKNLIPPDMSGYRWFYFLLTKKQRGTCVECKNETEFNNIKMKYSRFCNNPQCKQKYKEERDRRMLGKYGKVYLLDDPEIQKKMQSGRKIAGVYTWSDGKSKISYLGSYELDFLKYLDLTLNWPVGDIISPSPHTYTYEYRGEKHFYIPDAFIPSMNLEIEIKSTERMYHQDPENLEKDKLKDELMRSCSNLFNYIRIDNKYYKEFEKLIVKEE